MHTSQVEEIQVEEIFEPMIASKRTRPYPRGLLPSGALVAHPMKYKEKKKDSDLFLQVIANEDSEKVNTSEPILEKILL
jgi:hypothetical protein